MSGFNFFKLNIKARRRGQGLLEATLAIGIILVGLGAILTFTLKNISAATDSGQRIIAANLAREGIDVVRGIRDSNWLAASNSDTDRAWDDGLVPGIGQGAIPLLDLATSPVNFTLEFINSLDVNDSQFQLYRHNQDHNWRQFSPVTGPDLGYSVAGYHRLLLLDPICDDGLTCLTGNKIGIRVEAQVSWQASGIFGGQARRSLTVTEYLYNWR